MPSSQHSPRQVFILILIMAFLFAFIQISAISIVFEKLGLSINSAMLLFFCSLLGSTINLPVFSMEAEKKEPAEIPWYLKQLLRHVHLEFKGRTTIAVNVGGCLIPLAFSLYLFGFHKLDILQVLGAIAIVSTISYLVSRPIHGIGVGMPVFVAPITAALVSVMINPEQSAPIAYICGTMGVLIGADLLRLKDIKTMGVPIASIGGAGTFDGIFITGLVAVLLA